MQSKAADGLDSMAKSLLEQEEAKLRRNPGFGHSFRVTFVPHPARTAPQSAHYRRS